jgi:hypothetical protein
MLEPVHGTSHLMHCYHLNYYLPVQSVAGSPNNVPNDWYRSAAEIRSPALISDVVTYITNLCNNLFQDKL